MPPVVRVFVDVDDDESGDPEPGHGGDELGAALVVAAVPVEFRLADTQAFQRFGEHPVHAREVGRAPLSSSPELPAPWKLAHDPRPRPRLALAA